MVKLILVVAGFFYFFGLQARSNGSMIYLFDWFVSLATLALAIGLALSSTVLGRLFRWKAKEEQRGRESAD